jgi:hypothetical protein
MNAEKKPRSRIKRWWDNFVMVIVLIGWGLAAWWFFFREPTEAELAARAERAEQARETSFRTAAVSHCQRAVDANLRAPSTAQHPWLDQRVVRLPDMVTFEVTSYVDAQNAFGATIRTAYRCQVRHDGASDPIEYDGWTVVGLQMGN